MSRTCVSRTCVSHTCVSHTDDVERHAREEVAATVEHDAAAREKDEVAPTVDHDVAAREEDEVAAREEEEVATAAVSWATIAQLLLASPPDRNAQSSQGGAE